MKQTYLCVGKPSRNRKAKKHKWKPVLTELNTEQCEDCKLKKIYNSYAGKKHRFDTSEYKGVVK